jgi:hypothetical protein
LGFETGRCCGGGWSLAVDENDLAGLGDGVAVRFEAAIVHEVGEQEQKGGTEGEQKRRGTNRRGQTER